MSDLRSSVLKAHLQKLPAVPPWPTQAVAGNEVEDQLEEARDAFGQSSSPQPPPAASNRSRHGRRNRNANTFSPLTAETCFEAALEVDVPLTPRSSSDRGDAATNAKFRVYYTPPRPQKAKPTAPTPSQKHKADPIPQNPTGSFQDVSLSAASMAPPVLTDQDEDSDGGGDNGLQSAEPGTVFVFHHGAGFSALSYALTAAEITRSTNGEVGVLAFDCRGHGRTKLPSASLPLDMSLDALTDDLVALLRSMFPDTLSMPSLVLVGHSMGGSVVVSASEQLFRSGFTRISGVAVIDVVEGTAMDALNGMRSVVLSHPRGFDSVEAAIVWHIDSKTIANANSARISVPPLVERDPAVPDAPQHEQEWGEAEPIEVLDDCREASESQEAKSRKPFKYKWRADLLATEPHWKSWFQGLSARFLGVKTARLLLLAGTDRLDRELMIGQMQGEWFGPRSRFVMDYQWGQCTDLLARGSPNA
ncbi:Protein phosphatase methylesterase 1 [Thecaphora frezii]